jgi:hypothetical protein
MQNLPLYVAVVFVLTTLLTLYFFYRASNQSKPVLLICLGWLILQGIIGATGFYLTEDTVPPRFALLVVPTLIAIILLFAIPSGRTFLFRMDAKWLTWLHVVRIPVEIVLFWLFISKLVPKDMTFEGQNLDILSGITAPLIAYLGFQRSCLSKWIIIAWNVICLALLFNIVSMAILSAPGPFQTRAFDQPNIGVLYFPFVWLPCFIVPVVLLSHLVVLAKLLFKKKEKPIQKQALTI